MNIKNSSRDRSYLPITIWDMQELKHLQIMGSNLPEPCVGALLPNLLSLLDISVNSCTKEILEKLPMLKKLGVRIELAPDDTEPMYPFQHLSVLGQLESFKCVIVNPHFIRSQIVSPSTHFWTFPVCLKKLSLSGFGYSWESIRVIAQLPNLEVLKLRFCAFRGPEWVIHDGEFENLSILLLEDADLVHWKATGFQFAGTLIIRHCYKLKELPMFGPFSHAHMRIEVVDCPLIVDYLRQCQENMLFAANPWIHCSWYEEKPPWYEEKPTL
ncbi:hypothetical protein CDL12_00162 [Handroanthus impetiginosus]|uniref:Uncharacterized protein n=1 Tax=Handroanthus impetiginosus TaxID=429701 RepID=A0A2G9IBD9_9LAMI|nr:hypothetical protein CDL12_00162 [Handroanthus impetiginosus]